MIINGLYHLLSLHLLSLHLLSLTHLSGDLQPATLEGCDAVVMVPDFVKVRARGRGREQRRVGANEGVENEGEGQGEQYTNRNDCWEGSGNHSDR